ncbi:MAG: heme ABC exporter ATP-binding protein CcmA [Hyphomonadaceae bacterium]
MWAAVGPRRGGGIAARALGLARGGRLLFSDLSFAAAPGAFIEVRGPNGAGKTSLLRALAGFLRVDVGAVEIDAEAPAQALHYLGHRDGLKPALTARAHARYWAGLLGGEGAGAEAALARVGLSSLADAPARIFSQGQARRLALARLLAAPRPLWLLDEPAAGLDAAGKALLAGLIEAHCAAGGVAVAALHEPLGPPPTQAISL